jgi:amino acid adenylation domain-containing protein
MTLPVRDATAPLPVRPALTSAVPVTDVQRRLLLHHWMYPDDGSLNLVLAFAVSGPLDVPRLTRSVRRLLRECRALNTTFHADDGDWVAQHHIREIPVTVFRLDDTGSAQQEEDAVVQRLASWADAPIAPDRWPLYDVEILRGRHATYLTFLVSHLVADAYTAYNLVEALADLYAERRPVMEIAAELRMDPFATTPAARDGLDGAVEAFRRNLSGISGLAHDVLTATRTTEGLSGEHVAVDLPDDVAAGLERGGLIDRYGPVAVFLSVHAVLLSALTMRRTVVVGVPLGNRRTATQRKAFGYFVNTLPLAIHVDPALTFADLTARVASQTFTLLRHQGFDLAANAEAVFGRPQAGPVSVDNTFTYYKQALQPDLHGCEVRPLTVPRATITHPLSMNVERRDGGYRLCLAYLTSLAAADLGACVLHVVRSVATDPEVEVRSLGLVEESSSHRELTAAPVREYRTPESIDAWFQRVARERGDAVAVGDADGQLSYAELDAAAECVAGNLRRLAAGPAVAIAMRRSRNLLPVILGTLRAGKTYVPLDPSAPPERARHIAAQFDDLLLVADPDLLSELPVLRVTPERVLDEHPGDSAQPADVAPVDRRDQVAYVIFTSGSTGVPKGVKVTHGNVMTLFRAAEDRFDFGSDDVWCLFHSYAFDFSVWEMFGALLYGGRLVVVLDVAVRSPRSFVELLVREGVTVLNQTPSAFRRLGAVLEPADALAVRWVVFGGEALHFEVLRRWLELRGPSARLVNMYGITETTVHVTFFEVDPGLVGAESASVIGAPLPHLAIHVVDQNLNPSPLGVPGELLVSGAGVAHGYRNAPDLSAQRFLRGTPYADVVYRTGDLGIRRPDGTLVYLGRIDKQVQLRGYRIELGEVEAALAGVAGMREAVVRLDEPDGAEPRLVAYVVGDLPTDRDLRESLGRRVPAYMIPSVFVRLPRLPLTVNGKVAQEELPAPTLPVVVKPAEEGVDPLAADVARIWQDTVQAGAVDVDDNFFDIGGTSMHVAEVYHRLVSELGAADLAMVELFEHPTPAALARRIRRTGPDLAPAAGTHPQAHHDGRPMRGARPERPARGRAARTTDRQREDLR